MKTPFTLEAYLKDPNQKVETRDGLPVRIICSDCRQKNGHMIVALLLGNDDNEHALFYDENGHWDYKRKDEVGLPEDLFIVTPEPTYVDLGLPSGTLWADENETLDGEQYFTFDEANEKFKGRMPKSWQFAELVEECEHEWVRENGMNGMKLTGPNGNSVFFPASGCRNNSSGALYDVGSDGNYWSAVPYGATSGCYLYFNASYVDPQDGSYRTYGFGVRTVKMK